MAAAARAAPAPACDLARMGHMHMTRMADHDEDPSLLEGINYPGMHDVMLGRGGESTYHCGNIAFRQLVEDHKNQYYTCPRAHKSRVVAEVVRKWRQLTPPGRFLTRSDPNQGDKSPWHDVGDRRALKKASHSLRDAVRCFSIEKKQREKEQTGGEGRRSVTSSSGASEEGDYDRHHFRCEEEEDNSQRQPTMSKMEGRKRGRFEEEPEYMPSYLNTTKRVVESFGSRGGRESNGCSEFIATGASHKKPSIMIIRSDEGERPTKMRRVVCDEREEAEDDCRREGGDDSYDECGRDGGRDDERCGGEDRESSSREDHGGRQTFSFSSVVAPTANISIPTPSPFKQQMALPPAFLFHTPASSESFFKAPLVGGGESCGFPTISISNKEQERAENNASPCGSDAWFTAGMSGLPVAPISAFSLPTADVLVQEVSVNNANHHAAAPGLFSDEDSLGWFSDEEEEELNSAASMFTAAPVFHVNMQRPVVSRENSRPSSGRE